MTTQYPLDLSGVSSANYVVDEIHTVSEGHFRDYFFIVPKFGPFYTDNFRMSIVVNNLTRELTEDVDYSFALSYVTGTRITGKAMYGAVTLNNLELNGLLKISYQTVGGDQVVDSLSILSFLADKAYNPRTTIFDLVSNIPNAFPPTPHYQDYDSFYGQEELVRALGEIRDAIIVNSSITSDEIRRFLNNPNSAPLEGYVNKKGDRMDGPLFLARDPQDNSEAVNKTYVDTKFVTGTNLTTILSSYLNQQGVKAELDKKLSLTGGTMTGPIVLNAPPQQDMHPTNKAYVDSKLNTINDDIAVLNNDIADLKENSVTREELMRVIGELTARIIHLGG